ncbi:hypothetical protein EOM71_00580 [Candidatus Falkowbacteria bacterium]|nr:hypothetical protein [Candidatus Falkowbacteria bacterium]
MPAKKIRTTTSRHGSGQAKSATQRSAGRPPKIKPVGRVSKQKPRTTAKRPAKTKVKSQPIAEKKKIQSKTIAQPQIVVVTNQPLVTEEEVTAWQAARQEPSEQAMSEQLAEDSQTEFLTEQPGPLEQPSQPPIAEPFENLWPADNNYLPNEVDQRSGRLYRRLALFFIGLIAVVVMVMFYYSLLRVKIILYPADGQQANSQTIMLTDTVPVAEAAVPAKFLQTNTEYRQTFKATGQIQATATDGQLAGQVTLVNTTAKDQPLRATTRLLTADGVLYRLRNFVTVPANGQITAEAYADQSKPENAVIAATKFTIPGLWSGLQDKIYAVSNQDINYQSNSQPVVLATDLEQAISQAKQAAAEQAKGQLNQQANNETIIYWLDDSQWVASSDAQVGDKKAEFTITVKTSAGAAIISSDAIKELLNQGDDSSLEIDDQSLTYQLSAWQPEQHQAQLNVNYKANLSLSQADQLIDKQALVGLNRQQLETYLAGQPNLASYKVTWQPGFLKKVPGTDKIQLQLGR